ncbi:MAG TPA: serine hydrolase [Rubrivivax sp.]
MLKAVFLSIVAACFCCSSWGAIALGSAHAVVVDEMTGEVLMEKDPSTAAPIASLTKLMTAMVVLDARQDPNEAIRIERADMDWLKRSRSGVPVGAVVSRGTLIELALIASDNHAAAALARSYPGGAGNFALATDRKIRELGLEHTALTEPTGLSAGNRASALDMAKVLQATSAYPVIAQITSQRTHQVVVNGRLWSVRNTNRLVGKPGWQILASKTGFTNDAGRCLTMRIQEAGRTFLVVLIGAAAPSARSLDALAIRRWLAANTASRGPADAPLPAPLAATGARAGSL